MGAGYFTKQRFTSASQVGREKQGVVQEMIKRLLVVIGSIILIPSVFYFTGYLIAHLLKFIDTPLWGYFLTGFVVVVLALVCLIIILKLLYWIYMLVCWIKDGKTPDDI
jgi:uncharacterized membrane protein